jgi:hypothetical protein
MAPKMVIAINIMRTRKTSGINRYINAITHAQYITPFLIRRFNILSGSSIFFEGKGAHRTPKIARDNGIKYRNAKNGYTK